MNNKNLTTGEHLKFFGSLVLIAVFMCSGLLLNNFFVQTTHAQSDPIEQFHDIVGKSGLKNFENKKHELSSIEPGADTITSVIFTAIDFIKYLLATIAVMMVIVSGIKLITAAKKIDEVSEKEKENFKMIIYGLILIVVADELVTKVFFGDYGECIASASNAQDCAKAGGSVIKGVYSLVLALLGSIAVLMIAVAGFRMITFYGNEDDLTKQKKTIAFAAIGLVVAGVGEFFIKNIIFPESGSKGIDIEAAKKLVVTFTNFIAAFISAGAFVMLFYAGYMYVASAGDDEKVGKAKKIITSAIIGIVIAIAAYGIVTTVTRFSETNRINLPENIPGVK